MSARNRLSTRVWCAGLLASLLVVGCGSGDGSGASQNQDSVADADGMLRPDKMTTVRVLLGSPVYALDFTELLVADGLGYFEDENIDVEVTPVGGSTEAAKQLARGGGDIGQISPEPVMIGGPSLALATYYTIAPDNFYTVRVPSGSDIQSVEELKGKSIGVSALAGGSYIATRAIVSAAGLSPDSDVNIVAVGVGAQAISAVQQGQVQALGLWDGMFGILNSNGLQTRNIGPEEFPSSIGHVASKDFLQKNPATIAGLGRAVAKASEFIVSCPEGAVRAAWKANPDLKPADIPEEKALAKAVVALGEHIPNIVRTDPWGTSSSENFEEWAEILLEQNVLQSEIDVEQTYTNDFVEQFNNFDAAVVEKDVKEAGC
jgi:NitT/TauT family transport system substrate-binding protein